VLKSIRNLFESFPFYPLLLGMYPVFYLWQVNFTEVHPFVIWRSLIVSLSVTLLALLLCFAIIRPLQKAGAVAGLFLFLFFFYGHFFNLLEKIQIAGFILGRHRYMLPMWGILFMVGLILILRTRSDLRNLTSVLNLICLGLMALSVVQIGVLELKSASASQVEQPSAASLPANAALDQPSDSTAENHPPDIYYIVLDGYDRHDLLQQDIQLDNRDFIDELKGLGFVFPNCTMSNYNNTLLSMGATLNMNYIDQLISSYQELIAHGDNSTLRLNSLLLNNTVMEKLRKLGYQVITLKSGWPYLDFQTSDIVYDFQTDSNPLDKIEALNFQYVFLRTTLLRVIIEASIANSDRFEKVPAVLMQWINPKFSQLNNSNYMSYEQNLYQLDKLAQAAKLPGQKFFYAHLMVTHAPFTVTPTGQFQMEYEETKAGYADSVRYVNSQVLQIVQKILTDSAKPPIIILQGDHGYELEGKGKEAFKILNAYYLPGGGSSQLYSTITPVNTFRLIFSYYFHENFPLLADRSIWISHIFPGGYQEVPSSCVE
jgi:hypothetical protein